MSQTMLLNIFLGVVFFGSLVAEHYGIVPAGTANIMMAFAGGGAAVSGSITAVRGAPVIAPKTNTPAQATGGVQPVETTQPVVAISPTKSTQSENLTPNHA